MSEEYTFMDVDNQTKVIVSDSWVILECMNCGHRLTASSRDLEFFEKITKAIKNLKKENKND